MEQELVVLTKENIHELSTSPHGHGFCFEQIKLMGIRWPPPAGWIRKLIGRKVPKDQYDAVYHAGDKLRKRNAKIHKRKIGRTFNKSGSSFLWGNK